MSPCFAPNCKSGYNNKTSHCFRPHLSVASEWTKILSKIRSDTLFDPSNFNHRLCYLHFEPSLVKKDDTFTIKGEKVIIPRFRWQLDQKAVPTIFPSLPAYRQQKLPLKRKRRESAPVRIPLDQFTNCEIAKNWVTNETLTVDGYSTTFTSKSNTFKKILKIYPNFQFKVFCECKDVTNTIKERLTKPFNEIHHLPQVIQILEIFTQFQYCQGISGYQNILKLKNGVLKNQSWFSLSCQEMGFFIVCTPCKLLLPVLEKRMSRVRKIQERRVPKIIATKKRNKRFYEKKKYSKAIEANTKMKMEIKRLKITLRHINEEKIEKAISGNPSLPIPFQRAVISALKMAKAKSTKGMRYEMNWLLECLLLKIKSPAAYRHIRESKILPLPHPSTIRRLICGQPCEFGFNQIALNAIQNEMKDQDRKYCQGSLVFDEIQLRESLDFDKNKLQFDGFIDYGEYSDEILSVGEMSQIADHALVLMYRPLNSSWVQPVAAFGTKGAAKGNALEKIVLSAVVKLENVGAEVLSIVSDGAKTNKSFWKRLGVTGRSDGIVNKIVHPCNANRYLYFICDVPHIFKCIRNHFQKYIKVKFNDKTISYHYYDELWKEDSKRSTGLRKCPKLTKSHINPNSFEKMTVSLATQLFSRSCSTGLQFYRTIGEKAFIGSEQTEDFTKILNDTFDALNGRLPHESLKLGNDKLNCLKKILDIVKKPPKKDPTDPAKLVPQNSFASTETMNALRITISSIIEICEYLIQDIKYDYVLPNKLTQDCLERFFGLVRAAGGEEDHPTTCNFLQIFRILCLYTPSKRIVSGNITNYESNTVLVSFRDSLAGMAKQRKKAVLEKRNTVENLLIGKISQSVSQNNATISAADSSIVYNLCGYVIHKAMKFVKCEDCIRSLQLNDLRNLPKEASLSLIMDFGKYLKYPSEKFFNFINLSIEPALEAVLSTNELYGDIIHRIIDIMGKLSLNGIGCEKEKHDYDLLVKIVPFYITTRLYFYSNQVRNSLGHGKSTRNKRKLSKLQSK